MSTSAAALCAKGIGDCDGDCDPLTTLKNCGACGDACDFDLGSTVPPDDVGLCGQNVHPLVVTQTNGPDLIVVPVLGLDVQATKTLRLAGARPVVFVVFGDAVVAGTINASAIGSLAGPGGSGAGGGGFGSSGGTGGDAGGAPGAGGGVGRILLRSASCALLGMSSPGPRAECLVTL